MLQKTFLGFIRTRQLTCKREQLLTMTHQKQNTPFRESNLKCYDNLCISIEFQNTFRTYFENLFGQKRLFETFGTILNLNYLLKFETFRGYVIIIKNIAASVTNTMNF